MFRILSANAWWFVIVLLVLCAYELDRIAKLLVEMHNILAEQRHVSVGMNETLTEIEGAVQSIDSRLLDSEMRRTDE